jgi:hypothetical protein
MHNIRGLPGYSGNGRGRGRGIEIAMEEIQLATYVLATISSATRTDRLKYMHDIFLIE